jgi:hypothetical protein
MMGMMRSKDGKGRMLGYDDDGYGKGGGKKQPGPKLCPKSKKSSEGKGKGMRMGKGGMRGMGKKGTGKGDTDSSMTDSSPIPDEEKFAAFLANLRDEDTLAKDTTSWTLSGGTLTETGAESGGEDIEDDSAPKDDSVHIVENDISHSIVANQNSESLIDSLNLVDLESHERPSHMRIDTRTSTKTMLDMDELSIQRIVSHERPMEVEAPITSKITWEDLNGTIADIVSHERPLESQFKPKLNVSVNDSEEMIRDIILHEQPVEGTVIPDSHPSK